MRPLLAVASVLALTLCGCGSMPVKVIEKYDQWGRYHIAYMSLADTDAFCRKRLSRDDAGQNISQFGFIPACYSNRDNTIYSSGIEYDRHEYGHRVKFKTTGRGN